MSFPDRLARLDDWLQQRQPATAAALNPPASETEISSIEEKLEMELPEKLRQLYLWHDGEASDTPENLFSAARWPESPEYGPSDWAGSARWLPIDEAWRERNSVMDAVNVGDIPMEWNWLPSCLPIGETDGAVVGVELRNGAVFLYDFKQHYTDPWGQPLAANCQVWLEPLLVDRNG